MNIFVNTKPRQLDNDTVLIVLLQDLNIANQKGIAIAVNNEVIPTDNWDSYPLKENDQILIIKATQGG